MRRFLLLKVILLWIPILAAPAFAQVDFTGEWLPAYPEDGP